MAKTGIFTALGGNAFCLSLICRGYFTSIIITKKEHFVNALPFETTIRLAVYSYSSNERLCSGGALTFFCAGRCPRKPTFTKITSSPILTMFFRSIKYSSLSSSQRRGCQAQQNQEYGSRDNRTRDRRPAPTFFHLRYLPLLFS